MGAAAGEAGRALRITGRLVGGLSWAPSCSERSAAAGSMVRAACSVTLTGVVSPCVSIRAAAGETVGLSRNLCRLAGGVSWAPSSPECSTAASPVSAM